MVAAQTRLSHVDGDAGELIIAGKTVKQLAGEATFEQACALLWDAQKVDSAPLGGLPSNGSTRWAQRSTRATEWMR